MNQDVMAWIFAIGVGIIVYFIHTWFWKGARKKFKTGEFKKKKK